MFKLRNKTSWSQWVPLSLRLVIGFGFMAHGWAKLSRGPSGFAKLLTQVGAPLPETTAWMSMFVELLGGLAIFIGAFVEVVSVPLIVMMLVAMFTLHLKTANKYMRLEPNVAVLPSRDRISFFLA
jgi:putative oxidoreductase